MRETLVADASYSKKLKNEPKITVDIDWGNTGTTTRYTEADIVSVGGLNSVIRVDSAGSNSTVKIKLFDVDGQFGSLIEKHQVTQSEVTVYHSYGAGGTLYTLFYGKVDTPVTWSEQERTFEIEVNTPVKGEEVGFAPEEADPGTDQVVSEDAVGKAWPLCFGSPVRVPAVKITEGVRSTVLSRFVLITRLDLRALEDAATSYQTVIRAIADEQDNLILDEESYNNLFRQAGEEETTLNETLRALVKDSPTKVEKLRSYKNNALLKADAQITLDRATETSTSEQESIDTLDATLVELQASIDAVTDPAEEVSLLEQKAAALAEKAVAESAKIDADLTVDTSTTSIFAYNQTLESLATSLTRFDPGTLLIEEGEKFPQGSQIEVIINDLKIIGEFEGSPSSPTDVFTVKSFDHTEQPTVQAATDSDQFKIVNDGTNLTGKYFFINNAIVYITNQEPDPNNSSLHICTFNPVLWEQDGTFIIQTIDGPETRPNYVTRDVSGAGSGRTAPFIFPEWYGTLKDGLGFITGLDTIQNQGYEINPGDTVYLADDFQEQYVANLISSTEIKEVMAYRILDGRRVLHPVPSRYYTSNLSDSVLGQTCTTITFARPLTMYPGEDWEDGIFVTVVSSVGENTIDAIEHIVDNYTPYSMNLTAYGTVRDQVDDYPSHFALTELKDVFQVLDEICFQARCAAFVTGTEVKVKYLPKIYEISALASHPVRSKKLPTLEDSNTLVESLKIESTNDDDLVTKLTAIWRPDYTGEEDDRKLVVRNNQDLYGEHERKFEFYIYNTEALVSKSANYWSMRKSSAWKMVKATTFLTNLGLEIFDNIIIDYDEPFVVQLDTSQVTNAVLPIGLVEAVNYDPNTHLIQLEVWSAVKMGENEMYEFAYPGETSGP
jgi:hypothetical protein